MAKKVTLKDKDEVILYPQTLASAVFINEEQDLGDRLSELPYYVESPEFVEVHSDLEDKFLYGVNNEGDFLFGAGVPSQIQQSIDDVANEKVDRISGKGLIDSEYASCQSNIDSPEYLQVTVDSEDRVISGIKTDGSTYISQLDGLDEELRNVVDEEFANKTTLDKFSEQNQHLLWNGSPIEGDGVTQEELNQQLTNYPTFSVADRKYAEKSLENRVGTLSSELEQADNEIQAINRNINTINDGLSALSSPLPSGAIAGDNVWTGSNQFTQAITGVSGTNDNNVALYGQFKDTLNRYEDAADYGLDPSKSGIQNAQALNLALLGGNKTLVISKPGTYLIGDTILVDDNTTLVCGNGVILKKSSTDFCSVILNKGAASRTYNENISLIGLHISHNNMNALNPVESSLYGMRGVIGFICVKNLLIDNCTITDLAVNAQYAIHINTFEHITISNSYIAGEKDGIHLSDGSYFIIRNCRVDTYDDVIAMNSSDWDSSNCVDGDLRYGLIECCSFNYRGRLLMLVGAFVDWFDGMEIVRGDRVVSNGRVYRAVGIPATADDNRYYSHTEPSISTYTGVQEDSGGFNWKLVKDEAYYQTNVENITIRNCYSKNSPISARTDVPLNGSILYNRSIYPTVLDTNYPRVSCSVKDCVFDTGCFNTYREINVDYAFENVVLGGTPLIVTSTASENVRARVLLKDCDYTGLSDNEYYMSPGYRTHVIIDGAKGVDYIKFFEAQPRGRVESNYPCDISVFMDQKKGDMMKEIDGSTKIYNGSTWNYLTN